MNAKKPGIRLCNLEIGHADIISTSSLGAKEPGKEQSQESARPFPLLDTSSFTTTVMLCYDPWSMMDKDAQMKDLMAPAKQGLWRGWHVLQLTCKQSRLQGCDNLHYYLVIVFVGNQDFFTEKAFMLSWNCSVFHELRERVDDEVVLQCTATVHKEQQKLCLAAEGFGNRLCFLESTSNSKEHPGPVDRSVGEELEKEDISVRHKMNEKRPVQ
ncbi:hypothetical protein ACRRTK_018109 [Alexandromys fortis]